MVLVLAWRVARRLEMSQGLKVEEQRKMDWQLVLRCWNLRKGSESKGLVSRMMIEIDDCPDL